MNRPSQIKIECDALGKLLVREDWKNNGSTREAHLHEIVICMVGGRNMTGDICMAVCDKRSRRTMREFLDQKGRMKITTLDLVNWEAVDIIMDNSSQQFCL